LHINAEQPMRIAPMAVLVLMMAFLPVQAQTGGPSIVFDSPTKDFGKITEGEVIKHVFKFTNKGNSTLEIFKVEPS
jgi:hypothetical protein